MSIKPVILSVISSAVLSLLLGAVQAATLDEVKQRDVLRCGVSEGRPGFSAKVEGKWEGLDVDVCRAVAAATLGDASKVQYVRTSVANRIQALASGNVDVLAHNTTWTFSRDTDMGIHFVGVNFFDGQGFMVNRERRWESTLEMQAARICVTEGTTTEANLADYLGQNLIDYTPVRFASSEQALNAFENGLCDAYTDDQSALYGYRLQMAMPEKLRILPEFISKEPLSPAVATGDAQWFNIVRWAMFSMIGAEELGITSGNVDRVRKVAKKPEIKRFLGLAGDYGKSLGLDKDWAYRVISQVGNYAESFDRNLGTASGINMKRGQNALWLDGGLMYSPPLR